MKLFWILTLALNLGLTAQAAADLPSENGTDFIKTVQLINYGENRHSDFHQVAICGDKMGCIGFTDQEGDIQVTEDKLIIRKNDLTLELALEGNWRNEDMRNGTFYPWNGETSLRIANLKIPIEVNYRKKVNKQTKLKAWDSDMGGISGLETQRFFQIVLDVQLANIQLSAEHRVKTSKFKNTQKVQDLYRLFNFLKAK